MVIKQRSPAVMFVSLVLGMIILDSVLHLLKNYIIFEARSPSTFIWMLVFEGFTTSHVVALGIVAGCLGRAWVFGYAIALACAMLHLASSGFMQWCSQSVLYNRGWAFEELFPLLGGWVLAPANTLIVAAPFLMLRFFGGWRLAIAPQPPTPGLRFQIEDVFGLGAMVAVAWMIAVNGTALEFLPDQSEDNWGASLAWLLMPIVTVVFTCLPAAWLFFRDHSWWVRIVGVLAMCTVSAIARCCILNLLIGGYWSLQLRDLVIYELVHSLSIVALYCVSGWIGVRIFVESKSSAPISLLNNGQKESGKSHGVRMHQGKRMTPDGSRRTASILEHPSHDESVAVPSQMQADRRLRFASRLIIGAALLFTAGLGYQAALYRESKLAPLRRAQAFCVKFKEQGGEVKIGEGWNVRDVRVGERFDDRRISELTDKELLVHLSLDHSQVTDAGVRALQSLTYLRSLDLSYTNVTDACLESIGPSVQYLSLRGTKISNRAIKEFMSKPYSKRPAGIDIGDRRFGDEDLAGFPPVSVLRLADTQVTDAGLRAYLRSYVPETLDLRRTSIDGSGLSDMPEACRILILDGTPLKQQYFDKLLSRNSEFALSVRDTSVKLPDFSAPEFSGQPGSLKNISLRLGNGMINEQDLSKHPNVSYLVLSLSEQRFTGSELGASGLAIHRLDLRGSGVSDKSIQGLVGLRVSVIDLSGTDVSDACLPILSEIGCTEIHIRGTRITAAGIRTALPPGKKIVLDVTQFSVEDLQELGRIHSLTGFDSDTYGSVTW